MFILCSSSSLWYSPFPRPIIIPSYHHHTPPHHYTLLQHLNSPSINHNEPLCFTIQCSTAALLHSLHLFSPLTQQTIRIIKWCVVSSKYILNYRMLINSFMIKERAKWKQTFTFACLLLLSLLRYSKTTFDSEYELYIEVRSSICIQYLEQWPFTTRTNQR